LLSSGGDFYSFCGQYVFPFILIYSIDIVDIVDTANIACAAEFCQLGEYFTKDSLRSGRRVVEEEKF